jgi:hypothetical protein
MADPVDIKKEFAGLPIDQLICGPIIAVARGQAALCEVYLNYVKQIAYKDGKEDGDANILKFTLNRPVVGGQGQVDQQKIEVNAPLLSLIPVPAFTMDEATVQFTMEVKQQDVDTTEKTDSANLTAGYSGWGFNASFSGSVSSKSSHTRNTDHSAKYDIFARAVQQPPAEGMSRLCQVFASVIEPVPTEGQK